jgi:hypothetical protein
MYDHQVRNLHNISPCVIKYLMFCSLILSLCAPSTSTVKEKGEMGVKSAVESEIVDKNKKTEEKVKECSAPQTPIICLNPPNKKGKFTLSTTQSTLQSVTTTSTVAIPLPAPSMVIGNGTFKSVYSS